MAYKPFKDPNVRVLYTQKMQDELDLCINDPVYFMKNFVKIQTEGGARNFVPYDYQEEMVQNFKDHRNILALTSRQNGKCLLGNTNIHIRNKKTGEIKEITIEDFKNMIKK